MNENERLTLLLKCDTIHNSKLKPKYYKSTITNLLYDYNKYSNHGYGGYKNDKLDLPKNEYPFLILYE